MLSDYKGVYKQIIIGDESWIYAYDPETTDQSRENQSDSDSFLLLSGCCALRIPSNWPTVNKEYYLSVMRHLREAIRKKKTGIMGQQLLDFARL